MQRLVLLGVVGLAAALPSHDRAPLGHRDSGKCGYESCTKHEEGLLNVHIVPHSHDDVGWLKTVDQYYYGHRNNIQKAGVQYILDTVVKELWEDPQRRFIYVESFFFFKWWSRQTEATQAKVRTLVSEGRLQFTGGAWSMNDEAAAHYHSTVDQFTHGLRKLNDTFGPCGLPTVGWQIDPFGHSREFASLIAAMGYDGLFLGRIDYQDKATRAAGHRKTMEMVWRGNDDLGKPSDIFTGVLYNTYSPPTGFCFDIECSDEPIIDDVSSPDYNVERRVTEFLEICTNIFKSYATNNILITMGEDFMYQDARTWYTNLDKLIHVPLLAPEALLTHHTNVLLTNFKKGGGSSSVALKQVTSFLDIIHEQAKHFRTNNIALTMGGDFHYQNADSWFHNLDLLIEHTNLRAGKEKLKIKLFYSTPQCYLKAVKDANPTLPTKQDDFFPYASDSNAYWTGYFTSRPTTKYFERLTNNYLQMSKQLQVLADLKESNIYVLDELKSAVGIMQHHDAITGTEKQHVTHDYERILDNAIVDSLVIPREAFGKFMQGESSEAPSLSFQTCRLNESSCSPSESSRQFVVTVYNHLAWRVNESIRIPVVEGDYEVYAPNAKKIVSQIVPIPDAVKAIPTRQSKATHEVVFIAHLYPLSYKSFYIRKTNQNRRKRRNEVTKPKRRSEYYNINEYWRNIKNNPSIDIENMDAIAYERSPRLESHGERRIPDEPVYMKEGDRNEYVALNVDVMRDSRNRFGHSVEERIGKEAKRPILTAPKSHKRISRLGLSNLNEDERRVLADDPMVVQRFPEDIVLENQHLKLRFNSTTGKMLVASSPDGTDIKFDIKYNYYIGMEGNNVEAKKRASGAYIFRPKETNPKDITVNFSRGSQGAVVKEISVATNNNVASTIRLYDGLKFIENDWVVGPIDIKDKEGKEFIVRYVTDIVNNGEFYTDSNGRQMLKRQLGKRPQWNVSIAEPVAGNYYPVTNKISIKNDAVKISVLTDRSEGGSSLEEGQIELMLHRRLLHDDSFGVGEALNETVLDGKGLVVRGRHRLIISKAGDKEDHIAEKQLVIGFDLQPQIFVSEADGLSLEDWLKLKNCYSWANELPLGLHLLTLEPWKEDTLLLRLENYLEKGDRDDASIKIDLNSIFKTIDITSYKETTLAANRWVEDVHHWAWKTETDDDMNVVENESIIEDDRVEIKPKEIKTFVVEYKLK